jgi:hypothetical protein
MATVGCCVGPFVARSLSEARSFLEVRMQHSPIGLSERLIKSPVKLMGLYCESYIYTFKNIEFLENAYLNWTHVSLPTVRQLHNGTLAGFPPRRPGSGHVGFVVDKGAGFFL